MPSEDKFKRRYPRVETPSGIWAAWQAGSEKRVSRVRDLNVGGLFLNDAHHTVPVGSAVSVLLSVLEGEIRCDAVVRNAKVGSGIGLEFMNMSELARARLHALVSRLLQTSPNAAG